MIKKRRKMDKKKRKCLFKSKKKISVDESTEIIYLEQQDTIKTTIEKPVDINEVLIEPNNTTKLNSKYHSENESTNEKELDESKEESCSVEEDISTCESSKKTKQRCVFIIHCNNFFNIRILYINIIKYISA